MQPAVVTTDILTVTTSAAQAVNDLIKERNLVGYALRIFVAGKSCSGYQYGMSLDDKPADTDTTVEANGVKVLVDQASLEFVKGATLDFIDDERGKGFLVENPNVSACNCGDESGGGCCS